MNKKSVRITNWDYYYSQDYESSFWFVKFTRNYTQNYLIKKIKKYLANRQINIAELGGGNSCFFEAIVTNCNVKSYDIYDYNDLGIEKFLEKSLAYRDKININAYKCNLLTEEIFKTNFYDLVFSIGLVEHFDIIGTKKVIKKHFRAVNNDGIIIISTPTPIILYKIIRFIAELSDRWIFHDERPIKKSEIQSIVKENGGIILDEKILYLLGLTQYFFVIKKNNEKILINN